MFTMLPVEIAQMIAGLCSTRDQAALVLTCRQLFRVCNEVLYRNDCEKLGSFSVFSAIVRCHDDSVALGTLRAAVHGGAKLWQCRGMDGFLCPLPPEPHFIAYSPLHLAAKRGRNLVVSFLLDNNVPADGPPNMTSTPLFEAIINRREKTAILLLERGASLRTGKSNLGVLHAAVQGCLPNLVTHLVRNCGIDVNRPTMPGCTPLDLAMSHRIGPMVETLIMLGVDMYGRLLRCCELGDHRVGRWLIQSAGWELSGRLSLDQIFRLIDVTVAERVTPSMRDDRNVFCDALLGLLGQAASRCGRDARVGYEIDGFLGGHLSRLVGIQRPSIDRGLALVFLGHGARIQDGILLDLRSVLLSGDFFPSRHRALRKNPSLLQSFDFIQNECLKDSSHPPPGSARYFGNQVAQTVQDLVDELSRRNLPLSLKGLIKYEVSLIEMSKE
ncbi:uncharacterized protein F5Z01DRAFT_629086 [Emericellopsis atlantica]|uniref:F-box domain-containing protein n=1 Tax=Emericellopsis atlantica TaxID=2614577 RepID=A0A9P7ZEI2_9HYPO|nr:uncharacterized protein F5Z01DRAFT_629086 [Emericellopsis atlantica]KAG9250669.1 hypothetical protein F5Z01DRAFT_629086 [Emericellopsis atlantica]